MGTQTFSGSRCSDRAARLRQSHRLRAPLPVDGSVCRFPGSPLRRQPDPPCLLPSGPIDPRAFGLRPRPNSWINFLFVKLKKQWKLKTIREAVAAAKMLFADLLGKPDWTVFFQIRTKDHDSLPAVLTRQQVRDLLAHIRLRRYRTPLKLIYCCGLRLSECLGLTIHDIGGAENKLTIRQSKGHKDRVVPLPTAMYQELQSYWRFHRHPLLIFPNVGRGDHDRKALAARMHQATGPMPHNSLQRLLIIARKELNLPAASVHSLRHSLPRICWRPEPICTPSKSSSVTSKSPPPWFTCI